jgi:hypothetical protein
MISGHLSPPWGIQHHMGTLYSGTWDDAMGVFEGAQDGVTAEGRGTNEEQQKDLSRAGNPFVSTVGLENLYM